MKRYFLTTEDEGKSAEAGINPEFLNALIEIGYNEKLYKNQENLPSILKEFIKISKENGIELTVIYGTGRSETLNEDNCAGFFLKRSNMPTKAIFIEDFLVEKSETDKEYYDKGIEWFNKMINLK